MRWCRVSRALVAVLLNGRGGMPAFRNELDDAQVVDVLTYVRTAWGWAPATW